MMNLLKLSLNLYKKNNKIFIIYFLRLFIIKILIYIINMISTQSFESKKLSQKNRELLKKEISNLSYTELSEIFNIIRNNTDKYSENNNGVFINLKYIDDNTITKIWEFIHFSKKNKIILDNTKLDTNINKKKNNTSDIKNSTFHDKNYIHNELNRIKNLKDDSFSFQNFLEKLSTTNLKQFNSSDKINYPSLKNSKTRFEGVKARILKKCRDVNRNIWDNTNLNQNDNVTNDNEDDETTNEVNISDNEEDNDNDNDNDNTNNDEEDEEDFENDDTNTITNLSDDDDEEDDNLII